MGINSDGPVVVFDGAIESSETSTTWADLRLVQEKLLVQALIAGKSVIGIIDTGAEFSFIDKTLAASLKLPLRQPTCIQTTGGILSAQQSLPSS